MKLLFKLFLISLLLLNISCSNKKNRSFTQVFVSLKRKGPTTKKQIQLATPRGWGTSPSTISEFNCFMIMIGWEEPPKGTCKEANGAVLVSPNKVIGLFGINSEINVQVPSGNSRHFFLFGSKSDQPCLQFSQITATNKNSISAPVLLAQSIVDLNQAEQTLYLNADFTPNSPIINSCEGELFGTIWGGPPGGIWDVSFWDSGLWGN